MLAGQVMVGGELVTVMVKEPVAWLPDLSVATQVTTLVPTANV